MDIKELIERAHDNAVSKGFYECPYCIMHKGKCPECYGTGKDHRKNIGELLMLVVSELGEALEAERKSLFPLWEMYQEMIDSGESFETAFRANIKDTFQDELADTVIRIADMCGYLKIDLEKHIELKMKYNATREHKHGKKY